MKWYSTRDEQKAQNQMWSTFPFCLLPSASCLLLYSSCHIAWDKIENALRTFNFVCPIQPWLLLD